MARPEWRSTAYCFLARSLPRDFPIRRVVPRFAFDLGVQPVQRVSDLVQQDNHLGPLDGLLARGFDQGNRDLARGHGVLGLPENLQQRPTECSHGKAHGRDRGVFFIRPTLEQPEGREQRNLLVLQGPNLGIRHLDVGGDADQPSFQAVNDELVFNVLIMAKSVAGSTEFVSLVRHNTAIVSH
jgi:hypothetical protein